MKTRHPKIAPSHLARKAIVYLRQSTARQVRENVESKKLQYALVDRARKLGWGNENIVIIDEDLGVSASAGSSRSGFDRMVSMVALGKGGIILSREASRLSRNDKDWCQLLEVCQSFDTLIGDDEHIYDLGTIDDQLVLGIKGTMSVVELNILKMRMHEGREAKARRGEYFCRIAPGYIKDISGKIVMDPDERVREKIYLVFRKYRQFWSARMTWSWLFDNDIRMPVNKCRDGHTKIVWQPPTLSYIFDMLKNPFYAGVYSYGRRDTETVFKDGKMVKRRTSPSRRPEEYRVFLRDHHVGYIDWSTFEENQERMSQNSTIKSDPKVAAVRAGQGLLAGLLRCARCGRKLHVRYWGRKGTAPRYFCKGEYAAGGNYCISFSATRVDQRIAQDVLAVVSPLGIQASLEALKGLEGGQDGRHRDLSLEIKQLDYEVGLAREQYDQVDPKNRLVACELERRWNEKLVEREKLQASLADLNSRQKAMSLEEENIIRDLGERFPAVWESDSCPMELKKKIVQILIKEIVAVLEGDTIRLTIHWKGGIHSRVEVQKPTRHTAQKTPPEALDVIAKMGVRYSDDQIAGVLNKYKLKTGRGRGWTGLSVLTARRTYKIPGRRKPIQDPEVLSQKQAAEYCGVPVYIIQCLVTDGHLENGQIVPLAPWELQRSQLDSEPVLRKLEQYRRTGRYPKERGSKEDQLDLIVENKGVDNVW